MNGDLSEEITHLIQQHDVALVRYGIALTGNSEVARELVREAFERYLDARAGRKLPSRHPRAWLFRTVHRLAWNHAQVDAGSSPELLADGGVSSPAAAAGDAAIVQAWPALGILNERDRRTLYLRAVAHCSSKSIARLLNQTVHNVAFILHNSLKRVAREQPRQGPGP